jgi:C4-dicarboxylate transporter, DctM subunit
VSPIVACLVLIIVLALLGLPIGVTMLTGAIVYLGLSGQDISIAAETMLQGLYNGYTLLAIPLFILAAEIMTVGSLTDRLHRFSLAVVGRFKGGLGHVNVFSSMVFAGMSGSAIADAVGLGRVEINMLTKHGHYTPAYAAAITAASATLGPIIPPSIPMVFYALVSDTSVGYLFAAGILPGILMGIVLMVMNSWIAHKRDFPVDNSVPLRELPRATFQAIPALMLPVILLGGIYSGVMTPTEAAAVAAAYALLVSVALYRSVSWPQLRTALSSSSRNTASIGVLIACSLAINYVITKENIPNVIALWFGQFNFSANEFLLAVNILFLILGCFIDGSAILLIVVPILLPTVKALGIDFVHFGIVAVVNCMIGLLTPPFGLLLFVMQSITRLPMRDIVRELVPFLIALIGALGLITYMPALVLWVPRLLGYKG